MFSYGMGTCISGWLEVIRESNRGYSSFPRVFLCVLVCLCCREHPERTRKPQSAECPSVSLKAGAIGDKVRPAGTEAGPENSRKAACSAFTSSYAYAENNVVVFFPLFFLPITLPALSSCCNLFSQLDVSCSSSKACLAPSFQTHSSHIPKLSRKSFLLLHTPACSSFLVSTLFVPALYGQSVLVPAQMN